MTNKVEDIQIWECEKGSGHVMGLVKKNGRGVSFLVLYRNTIDQHADQPAEVDVMGVVHNGEQFRCQICGKVRAWVPNQAAYEKLMESYQPKVLDHDTIRKNRSGVQNPQQNEQHEKVTV